MDSATRLKLLERLVSLATPKAADAIDRACEQAYVTLKESNVYESLEFNIEVLFIAGFRRSAETVAAISQFMRSIVGRSLTYSNEHADLFPNMARYRNATTLVAKCIKVLSKLRYLETPSVVEVLLWLSTNTVDGTQEEAIRALKDLARFNLAVYYGREIDGGRGLGAMPQLVVVETLKNMPISDLVGRFQGALAILEGLLSTSMEATSWSSDEITFTRGVIPAEPNILNIRSESIGLLKRLYTHSSKKSQKLTIIRALSGATRAERQAGDASAYMDMIAANACEVLSFFAEVVQGEDLQIVQKIEHDSYWIQFNSPSEDVKGFARNVKAAIDTNSEYGIYRTLIGFEGIFGDWDASRRNESLSTGAQDARKVEARAMVARISDEGFTLWRQRILTFAETESNDLATFPVFYEFLLDVAQAHPAFALSLLENDAEALSKFLIPLLRGLWESEKRSELIQLIVGWIKTAEPNAPNYLYACVKFFLSTTSVDINLLRAALKRAVEIEDLPVLRQIASVTVVRSDHIEIFTEMKSIFLEALSHLTALGDAYWISEVWFRAEAKRMFSELSAAERLDVLKNLVLLPRIDFQAEDILAVIAEQDVNQVLDFLCARLYAPTALAKRLAKDDWGSYEELPFQLSALQEPMAKDPGAVVQNIFEWYRIDPTLFEFKGAKLLQIIFPQFSECVQEALLKLMREGGDVALGFIANILRAYSGEVFLYGVAKELIKRLAPGSSLLSTVAIALQSTGVVTGEYGFAEAYERKRLEVLDWLHDSDERVRTFASGYISELERMRDGEKARADEEIALRKFNFGED